MVEYYFKDSQNKVSALRRWYQKRVRRVIKKYSKRLNIRNKNVSTRNK